MIDLANEIWQTMRNNKLRTVLTGVAVVWGIFMLIVLLGMSRGVVNAFEANMGARGSNYVIAFSGVTTDAWHGYKSGRYIQLKNGDMDILKSRGDGKIGNVTAKVVSNMKTVSTDHDYASTSYEGVYPSEMTSRGYSMIVGRFINDADIARNRKVVVLSLKMAESLFPDPTRSVGEIVRIGDLPFIVVGVYDSTWSRQIYIPYSTARLLSGNSDNVDQLEIELDNVKTEADGVNAENSIRKTLASVHDFNPMDWSAVNIWNRFNQHLQMTTGMAILNITVWVIGIFTLLSGIIGVSNIMFVSVKERTHEIGIRRAIGAKPRAILTQIILESVSITTLFGYFGIISGTAVTALVGHFVGEQDGFLNPGVDLSIAFQVTIVLIIVGALAGLFPALKALKIKPVEALRDE